MSEISMNTQNNNNLPITLPPTIKTKPDLSKYTAYEAAAVVLKLNNPNLTSSQIGKQLVEMGLAKHEKSIYSRLKDNDYLSGELIAIENAHRETMLRETYPKAEKVVEEALDASNRRLKLKDKLGYVKLVYDKVHGETYKHVSQPTINVANIERMQVIINGDLDSTLQDAQKST